MSSQTELLWLGAALLLLLLLAAGLCVRCSHSEPKRLEKIYQQRSLQETAQSFAVARTYSLVRPVWARPPGDTGPDQAPTRKDKLLEFSPSLEEPASPRYQDSSKEGRAESEAASLSLRPITADYCNWGQLPRPQEEDDDAGSYENVLVCKQRTPESGEDSEDYQNSASIHQWQESLRIMEQAAAPLPVGSPDEDSGEPDYVNQDVAAPRA